jgi:hypothetical protein
MSVYFCEALTVSGFVQQLALAYVQHGYHFYVTGAVPEGKDPRATDGKLIDRYGINVSRWTRYKRARAGLSNLHYLRHGRFFVLIASRGKHRFWEEEAAIKDIRVTPVRFAGYSIGYQRQKGRPPYGWHPSVRIERTEYRFLKARFKEMAVNASSADLGQALRALPFEPYAPVRRQYLALLRLVNRRRKVAGLDLVPVQALRLHRRSVLPFGDRLAARDRRQEGADYGRISVHGHERSRGSASWADPGPEPEALRGVPEGINQP